MNLERAILLVLSASPRSLTPAIIKVQLPQFIEGDWTVSDVERTLKTLEGKGHAKGTFNEDTGTRWTTTDDGRLRIS